MPKDRLASDFKEEVFARLSRFVEVAKDYDITLCHENEKGIYGDTADRCLELMQEFYGENFKAIFDPANFVQAGEDTKRASQVCDAFSLCIKLENFA